MIPHTLWSECLEVTEDCRKLNADLLVTLGAGSLTDAAKIVALALANNASTFADLDALHSGTDRTAQRPYIKASHRAANRHPNVAVRRRYPQRNTRTKHGFMHGTKPPRCVVDGGQLAARTLREVDPQSRDPLQH